MVRRAPRARVLAAVRAAGRRLRAGDRRRAVRDRRRRAVRPARARGRALARRRRPPRRGCSPPACSPTSRSGGCRSCSGSRSRSAPTRPGAASGACSRASSALCAMLASPVAGVFLMLGAAAKLIADGRPALRTARGSALPALAGGIGLYLLFPEGGTDRFAATAFWPMLVISAAGVALLAPGRRTLWAGGLLYLGGADRRVLRAVAVRAERAPARRARRAVRARARPPQARAGVRARGRRRRAAVPAVAAGRARGRRGARRSLAPGSPSRPRRATS